MHRLLTSLALLSPSLLHEVVPPRCCLWLSPFTTNIWPIFGGQRPEGSGGWVDLLGFSVVSWRICMGRTCPERPEITQMKRSQLSGAWDTRSLDFMTQEVSFCTTLPICWIFFLL
ncbi:hypothetical protein Q9966_006610 [Columba livia]|nr:hypothetical protein Q9966_006610 [Columba livia]